MLRVVIEFEIYRKHPHRGCNLVFLGSIKLIGVRNFIAPLHLTVLSTLKR